MFKLFVLCFSILSLICAIQCTPTASKRSGPSAQPGTLVSRGHCDFRCPDKNVAGRELSKPSADPGRLYCRYDAEEADDRAYCMYNRVRSICVKSPSCLWCLSSIPIIQNTGELLSGSSPSECDQQAVFDCPGTKNSQEDMKVVPSQPKDSRSVNLPQFVKARSMARRTRDAETV